MTDHPTLWARFNQNRLRISILYSYLDNSKVYFITEVVNIIEYPLTIGFLYVIRILLILKYLFGRNIGCFYVYP
jgi:hypothetical protein